MMIRVLNFTAILMTGLICLGVYRIAEEARMTTLQLRQTTAAIAQENQSMIVLGAEWARITQPDRIQALAERHLNLSDRPLAQLASVGQLPPKFLPQSESSIRNANAVVPQPATSQHPLPGVASASMSTQPAQSSRALLHAGT
jgi:hypothetical protein